MNIENMIQGNPQALVKSVNGIMVADSEGFPYVQDGPKIKIPKWLLIEFINEKVRKGEPL